MNQEILDKLHTALFPISPLAEDREKIIAEMGETIWVEALEKMILALPEDAQKEVVTVLNDGDLDRAIELFSEHSVDIDAILTEVSTSVMDDVMSEVQPA
jgi:hypothetical protein